MGRWAALGAALLATTAQGQQPAPDVGPLPRGEGTIAGQVVHPDTVKAQVMSAIGMGLSAALYEELTLKDGAIQQTNFHQYKLLPLAQMPTVEVHIVPSTLDPGGVGQSGIPPIAPAACNAIFQATGKRIRRLPRGDQLEA